MDWHEPSTEARKLLYREIQRFLAAQTLDFKTFAGRVTGEPFRMGEDYERNLRAGRYSRKLAFAIYTWFEKHYPRVARRADRAVREAGISLDTDVDEPSPGPPKGIDPFLSLWVSEPSEETRFLYRSRSIPFVEEASAFEQLDEFLNLEQKFAWHVLHGPGGTGKSRLALEYMLRLSDAGWGSVGFLSPDIPSGFDWTSWSPDTSYFIAIDYAAREIDTVSAMVRALSLRDNLHYPVVRLLLIERDLHRTWFDKLTHAGRSERFKVNESWSDINGELLPPDDVWPIIAHMCKGHEQHLPPRDTALKELYDIDPDGRPLFAAFLGDAYRRGQNPRGWDRIALTENVLEHDRIFWDAGGVTAQHRNLCVAATMTRGIPVEWAYEFEIFGPPGFYPDWRSSAAMQALTPIFGFPPVGDVPPLEPDIVGEVFVIDAWREYSPAEKDDLIAFGAKLAPWFVEFLERAVVDFPGHFPLDFLTRAIESDFEEHEAAQPELLYNLATSFADHDARMCLTLIEHFDKLNCSDRAIIYKIQCLADSVHNFIVGEAEKDQRDLDYAYEFLRERYRQAGKNREIERSVAECAVSLIALSEADQPYMTRTALADCLRLHRSNKSDKGIARDAAIAISNAIMRCDESNTKAAIRYFNKLCALTSDLDDGETKDAILQACYHIFLLHLASEFPDSADMDKAAEEVLHKLKRQWPVFAIHEHDIVSTFQPDLSE